MNRALKAIGILIFFVHYYAVLALVVFKNTLTYFWKHLTQPSPQKQNINPFTATHSHVFANIGIGFSIQIKSFSSRAT